MVTSMVNFAIKLPKPDNKWKQSWTILLENYQNIPIMDNLTRKGPQPNNK